MECFWSHLWLTSFAIFKRVLFFERTRKRVLYSYKVLVLNLTTCMTHKYWTKSLCDQKRKVYILRLLIFNLFPFVYRAWMHTYIHTFKNVFLLVLVNKLDSLEFIHEKSNFIDTKIYRNLWQLDVSLWHNRFHLKLENS